MSCTHYRTMDSRRDRSYLDFKYPQSCYTTTCPTSSNRNSCFEVCNKNYPENYSNRKPSDLSRNDNETYKEGRGDPPFPDSNVQMARIASAYTTRHRESMPAISIEKMQICLKLLEDSNGALYLRIHDLTAENKSLAKRFEKDTVKMENLQENILLLQHELSNERMKLADVLMKQTKNDKICLEDKCTSSTDIVSKADREVQIWETCKDCHEKLEGCQREPTVTITKSEFELLEKDMQTLRDAVIVREEAWDKAMDRERNFRQQLARLTAEMITTRHLCETHQNEVCVITKAFMEKELELKVMQKEMLRLNKLIAKLHRHQKEHTGGDVSSNISEKDQKCIEEIIQRVRSSKGKLKTKFKYISDKYLHSSSSSSRENKNRTDQAGSSEDRQN